MKKYLSIIALALVITLSFTACSKDDDKKSDSKGKSDTETTKKKSASSKGNLLAKSASNTREQESVEIKGVLTFSGETAGIPLNGDFLIEGVQSFKTGQSQYTLDMTALIATLGGGAVDPETKYIIETRTVDGFTYTKTPSILGSAETWTKTTEAATGADSAQDPSQFIDYLKGATDDFVTVGEEDIEGVSTTHYKATLSPENFQEQVSEATDLSDEEIEAIQQTFTEPIEADVWIDEDSLIRKIEMTISIDSGALLGTTGTESDSSGKLTMKIVVFYSNYGVKVDVEAPPADQITE